MRNLIVTFMFACAILLASCSSNTPTGVVEKSLKALIEEDFETYVRAFYVEDMSDSEKVEKEAQDLVKIMKRNAENASEDKKYKSFEVLDEKQSKSGKWVRVTYNLIDNSGKENQSQFYLTKDNLGNWKILMFGTEKLMDE